MTFSMRFLACAVAGTAVVTAQRDVPYVFANVCHPPSSLTPSSSPSACNVQILAPPFRGSCPHAEGKVSGLRWCCWEEHEDRHISAAILRGQVPDMESTPVGHWKHLLQSYPPGIVVDAGSQVGLFTGIALAFGHHVIAVDARPDHTEMLTTSLKLNGLESAATVVHAALGSECGKMVTIEQHEQGNPGSSHIEGFRRLQQQQHSSHVPMLSLDSIIASARRNAVNGMLGAKAGSKIAKSAPVLALKLDVEGLEARVLMGAARLMAPMHRPKLIIMEVFVSRLTACNVRDFIGGFGQLNYTVDVSARLNMPYCADSSRCKQLSAARGLGHFLESLSNGQEMDLVFFLN